VQLFSVFGSFLALFSLNIDVFLLFYCILLPILEFIALYLRRTGASEDAKRRSLFLVPTCAARPLRRMALQICNQLLKQKLLLRKRVRLLLRPLKLRLLLLRRRCPPLPPRRPPPLRASQRSNLLLTLLMSPCKKFPSR
jgi:hypothetical protein